jgi:hypothetical protein
LLPGADRKWPCAPGLLQRQAHVGGGSEGTARFNPHSRGLAVPFNELYPKCLVHRRMQAPARVRTSDKALFIFRRLR